MSHVSLQPSAIALPFVTTLSAVSTAAGTKRLTTACAPSVPTVKKGDKVSLNEQIAASPDGLGVALHSSVDGTVTAVGKTAIIIETDKG